ncbi:MAG: hypothetical protein ACRDPS_23000 [Nocardioides sp.]|uniref:hypothetical protein n=1 Tax=Nocardioides sp. TaxID=35761 RepID=UPI003D6A99CC
MSRAAAFCDLDRTLVYSPSALSLPMPDAEAPRLVCVEVYDGRPLSFMTEPAAAGIATLNEAGALVPVTTRTPEQYHRIHLPGPTPKFAVTANGGRLLRDGLEDLDYSAALSSRLESSGASFEEIWAHLGAQASSEVGQGFIEKHRNAESLFCYAVVRRSEMPASWLVALTGFCEQRGWKVSVQGRKVYCVPDGLSKGVALREVAAILGVSATLAAGDSILDRELLQAADLAIRPAHGELHETSWTAPHLTVTAAAGVLAGEEIVSWLGARL